MKIILIGAATSNHTKRWVNALSKRGHEVLLVCRPDQTDIMKEVSPAVKIEYLPFGGKTFSYYLNAPRLKKIIKNFKPDIVNAHYASGYGTLARMAGAKNLVISTWGSDVYSYPYKNKICMHIIRKNFKYASAIAATSHAMAEQTKRLQGEKAKDVTVTPFGVDIDLFQISEKKENKQPIIGIVKYLEPIYDIPLLIKAFAIVAKESEVKPLLHIYGDGKLRGELEQLTRDLGVEQYVTFFGTIPNKEVPQALQNFDIFVNCSLRESFGVAIVEAMACKLPIVATDTEGFREVVVDGETGYVLKDREPETMAAAFRTLLDNPELRREMGENGRKRVLEEYDWERNVDVMEKLFESVCRQETKNGTVG